MWSMPDFVRKLPEVWTLATHKYSRRLQLLHQNRPEMLQSSLLADVQVKINSLARVSHIQQMPLIRGIVKYALNIIFAISE